MAKENTQQKLSRVRPPRVQITYDVEVGGATELKELPFVMGVLSNLSGDPATALPSLKERKFVEITPDNVNSVLTSMHPRLAYIVDNKLSDDAAAGQLSVELKFNSFEDFSPEQVAQQIAPLRELLELRTKLSDLRGSLQGNEKLEDALFEAVTNTEAREKLRTELNATGEK